MRWKVDSLRLPLWVQHMRPLQKYGVMLNKRPTRPVHIKEKYPSKAMETSLTRARRRTCMRSFVRLRPHKSVLEAQTLHHKAQTLASIEKPRLLVESLNCAEYVRGKIQLLLRHVDLWSFGASRIMIHAQPSLDLRSRHRGVLVDRCEEHIIIWNISRPEAAVENVCMYLLYTPTIKQPRYRYLCSILPCPAPSAVHTVFTD